ncbi:MULTISPECIES: hypothetical protein [Comamonas]|uniref:hypothetical protein n=1 Tax=Comamonas TaxID=283 RepID=UPI0001DA6B97|nr:MULTISPECIES: hypothetical protein [Comamonas]EFI63730.1 hypothetical protein CTS44_00469 [Comamonas thiooxydans]TFF59280.1 hypothetical protein EIC84_15810 [Comamonas sp. A23]
MTGASRIWPWLALALALLLAVQTQRLAKVETSQAKQAAAQAQQSQADTETKAVAVVTHGAAQQENTHDYTQEMVRLEARRTADAARIAGLQHDIRGAATLNAQLAGDAAACRGIADQHQRLAALAAEGAEVVTGLAGMVRQRDVEVKFLQSQALIDRALIVKIE